MLQKQQKIHYNKIDIDVR